ncbi:FAST kinase domain-containing protein 3, mitochondrial isoform X4 [Lutra lutra]|uniref:FAST kinase domain-containing protein 3, mitochondrial isoform X4 n=1 Tax=Lutra lutra TaxID=9657 RepID=UPI001FD072D0|nr:FAST kinase domain-containing protein 3, mitochondrial isoform X4 [Lutra lutra]
MALITLWRNLCHLSDFRIHGALAALKNHPIIHVHKVAEERLCPWFCSPQAEPLGVRFHHGCCKNFHSENGNDLHPAGEPVFSEAHDWDRPEQSLTSVDEPTFYRRLNSFTSSEEVLSFISCKLQTLPDTLAAGALQRICEVGRKDGDEKLPKEILKNRVFQALCIQCEQEPSGEESCLDRLSLAQLTQLFLTSVLECPFYKGQQLFPKYRVRSFLTPCSSLETPMDFQLYKFVKIGLVDLLGARLYFAPKVLTPYCYTIDVEIKLDEEGLVLPFTVNEDVHKRVALCIDDPNRFSLNTKHLLGKEAVKQRHLRLLGFHVVQIPYYEIELLKSRVELVEYLQRKLFPQKVGVPW